MDHNKWQELTKSAKGINNLQSEKGDKKEKHNASGSSTHSGSEQATGFHRNDNNNPRTRKSLDRRKDYTKYLRHVASSSDRKIHGESSKRNKRNTTGSRSPNKGQGQIQTHGQDSQPIAASKDNNMQRQRTDDTNMNITPGDGSTFDVAQSGANYENKHNVSLGLHDCLECDRHSVYHNSGSDYHHHVEKEEHDTLHEVAHGLHFASVALLGFLVFEVMFFLINICLE